MNERDHCDDAMRQLRVVIVSEHASAKFGGEACLPWHYFRNLRKREIESWLVVHERTRDELRALLPAEAERMYFLPDTWFDKFTWKMSRFLPAQISNITLGYASRLTTQRAARKLVRRLIMEKGVNIVHQPIPVSPREPSLMHSLGVPVVMGPMNGNMIYPKAFVRKQRKLKVISAFVGIARRASILLHRLMPGKLQAAALLVANERTRRALPPGARGEVIDLVENGVDLDVWFPAHRQTDTTGVVRFIFLGRLVDWKAVDLLLEAFVRIESQQNIHLEIVGDGPMRPSLESLAATLGIADRVHFAGWQSQTDCATRLREADVLVLPSLFECGGAVVLEAMACSLPVIATAWGGPADYLNPSCGILIPPDSRESLVAGLAAAMSRLASDPALRAKLGSAGRRRVEQEFNWDRKIDCIIDVYRRVIATANA